MTITRSVLLRMKNVTYGSCGENQNTHFVFSNNSENSAIYEILWEKYARAIQPIDDNTMKHRNDDICMPDN
jgi:hypothetical protein